MAKKVRRVKKKRQRKRQAPPARVDSSKAAVSEVVVEQQLSSTDQFRHEYGYVVKDLRRVLILAAIMFAVLITLNLLLQ